MKHSPARGTAAASTHVGRVRMHNEDAYLVDHELGLFAVADGVGGHGGGSEASQLTVTELPKLFSTALNQQTDEALSDTQLQTLMDESIHAVNEQVYQAGTGREKDGRMGTTLTGGLFLDNGNALIFNVGDSRTYVFRDNALTQITVDQSWYQSWLDDGGVGIAPPKNVILQGIGLDKHVYTDWVTSSYQLNDVWLMCSDGLTDLLSNEDISRAIEQHANSDQSLDALCEHLINAANDAGGADNITVLVVQPNHSSSLAA